MYPIYIYYNVKKYIFKQLDLILFGVRPIMIEERSKYLNETYTLYSFAYLIRKACGRRGSKLFGPVGHTIKMLPMAILVNHPDDDSVNRSSDYGAFINGPCPLWAPAHPFHN